MTTVSFMLRIRILVTCPLILSCHCFDSKQQWTTAWSPSIPLGQRPLNVYDAVVTAGRRCAVNGCCQKFYIVHTSSAFHNMHSAGSHTAVFGSEDWIFKCKLAVQFNTLCNTDRSCCMPPSAKWFGRDSNRQGGGSEQGTGWWYSTPSLLVWLTLCEAR